MAYQNNNIENIDREIIELISRRSDLYIKRLKDRQAKNGLFSAEERSALFKLIEETNQGPLPNGILEKVYTDIVSAAITALAPVTVAFLGPEGSFSNVAVKEFFGESVIPLPQRTIEDVFEQVEAGMARYGMVPIENSTEGSVSYTLDQLTETSLSIISEKYIRITYSLLSKERDIHSIKKIYLHPQTLGQCKGWIRMNLPHADVVSVESTSRAAELAAKEKGAAAIASELVAGMYALNTLATRIEDARQNYTRFFLLGAGVNSPTGSDKTSIVCAVKDKPGALLEMLKPFADERINMTKIESRPDKKKMWEYNFFIDFMGHMDDAIVKKALERIKQETIFLKILGSYPVGN